MRIFNKLCLCTLFLVHTVNASECLTNTPARKLSIDKSEIKFETLDKNSGQYVATLVNGDLIMASFLQCELGMNAHLYSRKAISTTQRAATLRSFLSAILPNNISYAAYEKQIDSSINYVNDKTYTLSNESESHSFEFKASESPLFKTALHYRWQPPLH